MGRNAQQMGPEDPAEGAGHSEIDVEPPDLREEPLVTEPLRLKEGEARLAGTPRYRGRLGSQAPSSGLVGLAHDSRQMIGSRQ